MIVGALIAAENQAEALGLSQAPRAVLCGLFNSQDLSVPICKVEGVPSAQEN